jgi:hypothetical protein
MNLYQKYQKITKIKDRSPLSFNTVKLNKDSEHFLGVNGLNQVAILFNALEPTGKNENIRYLTLEHSISCTIYIENLIEKKKLSILKLETEEENLKEIFLRSMDNIVQNIPNNISQKRIYELTQDLIKLFEKIYSKKNIDLLGFWGELFIIKHLRQKELLIEGWHPETNDTFDFMVKNNALEIKTSNFNERKHHFSFEQLNSNNKNIIVASILIRKSRGGYSLLDLKSKILMEVNNKNLKDKLQEIYDIMTGSKTQEDLDENRYSYEYAKDNILFYDSQNVPRIKETPMYGVKNIKFESDLSGVKAITDFSNYEFLK